MKSSESSTSLLNKKFVNLRILIIDDNLDEAKYIKKVLKREKSGCIVKIINDTRKVIPYITSEQMILTPFDIAIIDYWTPGMLGDELGMELRRIDKNIQIILYTSDPDPKLFSRIANNNNFIADSYWKKTVNDDEIVRTIQFLQSNKESENEINPVTMTERINSYRKYISDMAEYKINNKMEDHYET